MILLNDGTILATGDNYKNLLGLNKLGYNFTTHKIEHEEINVITKFTRVQAILNVKQIACHKNRTMIISDDGKLYVNGQNNFGILGLPGGNGGNTEGFKRVPHILNVKTVVCGSQHTVILLNDGTVLGAGIAMLGQLGCPSGSCMHNAINRGFRPIRDISDVEQIFAGPSTTMILLNDGTILATGSNTHGQLGLNDTINKDVFTLVPDIQDVKQIAFNQNHTMILLNNGTILGTGDNHDGRLGLGDTTNRTIFTPVPDISNVETIVCGYNFTMIVLNDGTLLKTGMSNIAGLDELDYSLSFIPVTFSEDLNKLVSTYDIIE